MGTYSPNTTTIAISHVFSVFLSFCAELYVEISGSASVIDQGDEVRKLHTLLA
jgi:hypothetical protein